MGSDRELKPIVVAGSSNSNNKVDMAQIRAQAALELRRRKAALEMPRNFYEFVRMAWPLIEFVPFVDNWHIGLVCEALEAVLKNQIKNLIINIPPRCMKSLLACVFFPAYSWTLQPHIKFLSGSYSLQLSIRDSQRSRHIIRDTWYQERWGDVFSILADSDQKQKYENNKRGSRLATSVGGSTMGEGGDIKLMDDPHKAEDVRSDTTREAAIQWWGETWVRASNNRFAHDILIMQRLGQRDYTGYIMSEIGGYEHLVLPMRFEEERKSSITLTRNIFAPSAESAAPKVIGTEIVGHLIDPRTKPGELLWEEHVPEERVQELEKAMGATTAAGQLQQRPQVAGGNYIKEWNWRYWAPAEVCHKLPPVVKYDNEGNVYTIYAEALPDIEAFDIMLQSWDTAFKDETTSDHVSGGVWGALGSRRYLLEGKSETMGIVQVLKQIIAWRVKYPKAARTVIEDSANGPAIKQLFRGKVSGVTLASARKDLGGDKVSRVVACEPASESHDIYLPHPHISEYTNILIQEFNDFPNGIRDDNVDQVTQANIIIDKKLVRNIHIRTNKAARVNRAPNVLDVLTDNGELDLTKVMLPPTISKRANRSSQRERVLAN